MMKDPKNFNNALIPCIGSDCHRWNNGKCYHLYKLGKYGVEYTQATQQRASPLHLVGGSHLAD